jgi:hypothetical protein
MCAMEGGGGGRCGGVGSLLTFDIPQTALVATLDTYYFYLVWARIEHAAASLQPTSVITLIRFPHFGCILVINKMQP